MGYLGNSYAPTSKVDVYVDANAIKKPYTIIGKGFIDPSIHGLSSLERMQENVVDKAKEKGAIPIVMSPIPRNKWKDGKLPRNNTSYGLWAKQIADQENKAGCDHKFNNYKTFTKSYLTKRTWC